MHHDVELDMDRTAAFPDRCLVCGREHPGEALRMRSMFNGMKPLAQELLLVHVADVPVCAGCKIALTRSRWIGKLAMGLAILLATVLVITIADLPGVGGSTWLDGWRGVVVLFAVVFGPLILAQLLYTPHFDFSPWSSRVVYEFRDRAYAEDFAKANDARLR